ncbi:MAG: hypothetical protein M1824_004850 [Vezdaea acicularis]|nr:MAG: hypothetical protein M1824_004850 [Vezdaea acicularis]
MSSDARPISPSQFALALKDLPVDVLHAKTAELLNSVVHLSYSNQELVPFADNGDVDCKEAIRENEIVIKRFEERILLLRKEVENRGLRWSEAETEENQVGASTETGANGHETTSNTGGRLGDDEMRRRIEELMGEDEEPEGVHL